MVERLPASAPTLFNAKKKKNLSFEEIAKHIGRDEVAVAALFYGQAKASGEDVKKLSELLDIDHATLEEQLTSWPDRGRYMEMPPREPLVYRLYEIVQNYGYAYKAVLNEKFGDGIMSAISFSTHVEKEKDDKGADWVKITLRGKWYVNHTQTMPRSETHSLAGCHILVSSCIHIDFVRASLWLARVGIANASWHSPSSLIVRCRVKAK